MRIAEDLFAPRSSATLRRTEQGRQPVRAGEGRRKGDRAPARPRPGLQWRRHGVFETLGFGRVEQTTPSRSPKATPARSRAAARVRTTSTNDVTRLGGALSLRKWACTATTPGDHRSASPTGGSPSNWWLCSVHRATELILWPSSWSVSGDPACGRPTASAASASASDRSWPWVPRTVRPAASTRRPSQANRMA